MDGIDLEARLLALRLIVEPLWAALLTTQPEPLAACRKLAEEGNRNIEGMLAEIVPGAKATEFLQRTLRHHDELWTSIEKQLLARAE